MALIKTVKTNFGIDASYWFVDGLSNLNNVNKTASINVLGYASKEARETGCQPLASISYQIENVVEEKNLYVPMDLEEIKQMPEHQPLNGQQPLSDTQLLGLGYTVLSSVVREQKNYFDDFYTTMLRGSWQKASYEFLKTNTKAQELFADALDD